MGNPGFLLSSLVDVSRPKICHPHTLPLFKVWLFLPLYWFHCLMGSSLSNKVSITLPRHTHTISRKIPVTNIHLSTFGHMINPPAVTMDREDAIQWVVTPGHEPKFKVKKWKSFPSNTQCTCALFRKYTVYLYSVGIFPKEKQRVFLSAEVVLHG